jgi:subtilisin family serine protease
MNRMWLIRVFCLIVSFTCASCVYAPESSSDLLPVESARAIKEKGICSEDPIRIAVIDTGLGYMGKGIDSHLCKYGHRDFTKDGFVSAKFNTKDVVPLDAMSHGTNVVGLIDKYASKGNVNYCIVVLKFYGTQKNEDKYLGTEIRAIEYARKLHVDFINLSLGGTFSSSKESKAIKRYLDEGGHVIAAAGNESSDLAESPFYPAMDDSRVIVVGSLDEDGEVSKTSNYGSRVNLWEMGEQVTGNGVTLTGTSQATAIATGKIVAHMKNTCYKN